MLWNGRGKCEADAGDTDCSAVYEAARDHEQAGRLREAAEMFRECAADSCSNSLRQTCQAKLFRLELDEPSVVPLAKDQAGAPLVDVEVTMDGVVLASRLDGRAFAIDPGLHDFVFRAGGSTIGSKQLVIAQGQRNRAIWMTQESAQPQPEAAAPVAAPELPALQTASASHSYSEGALAPRTTSSAPRAQASRGGSVWPYLLGGSALAGAGAYLMLSNWARGDNQQLGRCSPTCPAESVAHIRTLYLAADISLGVAAAAALSSAAWFVFSSSRSREERPAPHGTYALTVQPERAGALATLRGSF
jgi:hypothetical protein